MIASRLFWKLLLVGAGVNLAAAAAIALTYVRLGAWAAIAVAALLLLVFVAWLAAHVVRPIRALASAAEEISTGNYRHRVYVGNRDELGSLARAFNRVSQELETRAKQLGQTGDRQSTVLGGMIEGVIAVDERQRIVLANAAAGRLFEFSPRLAEGRPLMEVVRNHALHQAVNATLATSQPQRLETKSNTQYPDLSEHGRIASAVQHVDIHVQPLPGEPCPGVVLVIHDTTELRRLESLRRDFIANVSHELKTPLSSIKAYAETLRNGALRNPETSDRFLARIEEQADRLHHLILEMLMLARIESDQQVFEIVAVDVPTAVARSLEHYRTAAKAKQITLAVEPNQPPCRAQADQEGLREIIDNLVDNAIKYTPGGGSVSISWSCDQNGKQRGARGEEREGNSPQPPVRIVVRDTGIGIKPEDQLRVFERFYRVDKARSRELGSTGLGLAIVKHLAQAFGGSVHVESEPGKGSAFAVELPQG